MRRWLDMLTRACGSSGRPCHQCRLQGYSSGPKWTGGAPHENREHSRRIPDRRTWLSRMPVLAPGGILTSGLRRDSSRGDEYGDNARFFVFASCGEMDARGEPPAVLGRAMTISASESIASEEPRHADHGPGDVFVLYLAPLSNRRSRADQSPDKDDALGLT